MNYTTLGPILATLVLVQLASSDGFKKRTCYLESEKLPKRVRPTHYEVVIRPNLDDFTFKGQVAIDLSIVEDKACQQCPMGCLFVGLPFGCDPKEIILHADTSLNITEIEYTDKTNQAVMVKELCTDPLNKMISIRFGKKIPDDSTGRLRLVFNGKIQEYPSGFYKSPYFDLQKQIKYSAATHFKPTHTRKAFPCFDEPELEATFSITIEHERHLRSLSSMETVQNMFIEENSGHCVVKTRFAQTPPISTHLVAFVIGEFDQIESTLLDDDMQIRAFTAPGLSSKGEFVLNTAREAFLLLFDHFEIEQPLRNKIDLVFLKRFFPGAGAIQNGALVTLSQEYFFKDKTTSPDILPYTIVTSVYAISHFWLGNLVTPKWWEDSWLKKSFAMFMSYEIANKIYPEHNFHTFYLHDHHIDTLNRDSESDANQTVRSTKLNTATGIGNNFDDINLKKGCAVVRMLSKFVGDNYFSLVLKRYLRTHNFDSADENGLWDTIEARGDVSVSAIAKSWLEQPGYPLLTVEYYGYNKIRIQQRRFDKTYLSNQGEPYNGQRWIIPISVLVSRGDGESELLDFVLDDTSYSRFVDLPKWFDPNKGHWVKLNANFEGFYRVKYETYLLNLLEHPIKTKQLSAIDRLNILDDIWASSKIGATSPNTLNEVLSWFKEEEDPGVMYTFINIILESDNTKRDTESIVNFFEKNGGFDVEPSQSLIYIRARMMAAYALVVFQYQPVIEKALKIFDSTKGDVPAALRLPLYAAVAGSGYHEQTERLINVVDGIIKAQGSSVKDLTLVPALRFVGRQRREVILSSLSN